MCLAQNLKYLREQKGLRIFDIARFVDLGERTVATWEQGIRTPRIKTLVQLADFFGVTLDQLVKQDLSKEVSG